MFKKMLSIMAVIVMLSSVAVLFVTDTSIADEPSDNSTVKLSEIIDSDEYWLIAQYEESNNTLCINNNEGTFRYTNTNIIIDMVAVFGSNEQIVLPEGVNMTFERNSAPISSSMFILNNGSALYFEAGALIGGIEVSSMDYEVGVVINWANVLEPLTIKLESKKFYLDGMINSFLSEHLGSIIGYDHNEVRIKSPSNESEYKLMYGLSMKNGKPSFTDAMTVKYTNFDKFYLLHDVYLIDTSLPIATFNWVDSFKSVSGTSHIYAYYFPDNMSVHRVTGHNVAVAFDENGFVESVKWVSLVGSSNISSISETNLFIKLGEKLDLSSIEVVCEPGYEFQGWYVATYDGAMKQITDGYMPSSGEKIYAIATQIVPDPEVKDNSAFIWVGIAFLAILIVLELGYMLYPRKD